MEQEPAWKARLAAITARNNPSVVVSTPAETIPENQNHVNVVPNIEEPTTLLVRPKRQPLAPGPSPPPPTPATSPLPPQSGESQLLNTHHYDGQLKDQIDHLGLLKSGGEFGKVINNLKAYLSMYRALEGLPDAGPWKDNFDTIVRDRESNPQANFDPTNGVDASEMLYNIELKIRTLLNETCIQLEEISNGSCPQGRATRLLYVLLAT